MGILINTGFDVGSSSPVDNRTLKDTINERDVLVSEGKVYENLKVYCKDTKKEYRWTGTEWETVGSGGADTATITEAVNTYLAENPVEAMTDEQIATSVNKSISDGSIEVMSEVEDGSIVLDKLNYENVFGAIKYEVYKSGAWCTFTVNLNGTTGLTSNLEFSFISDTILNTLVNLVVVYANAGYTNDVVSLSYVDNGDGTYTYTGTLATLKSNVSKVQLQYRGKTGTLVLSGIFSNISVVIDGVNIETTVLIEDGVTTNKEENPLIATKSNLNNSTLALNNKIDDGLLYARNKVYENQLKNLKLAYSINSKSGFSNTSCTDIEGGGVKITGGGALYDNREITTDTFCMEMFFDIIDTTTSTRLGFFTRSGAIFMVNVTDNTLEILEADINYGTDNGNIIVSKTIPWTLTNSEKYKLALVKDELTYTLILTNLATGESISIYTTLCYMFGTGRVGIKTYGTTAINVYKYDYYLSNYKYSNVLIMGDSITQGVGLTDINNRWCGKLLKEYYEGDGVIWGKGFDTSSDTLTRLTKMFKFGYKFNKVIIMIGTNNTGSDETYTTWESNIVDIYNLIIENGAEPIICVPPSKRANMSNVLKMRDFILSKGWNTIRMDIATSVDQLGQAIDETITTDGTHFNDKGNLRMYERAVKDLNNGILLEDNNDHTHDYSEITNTPTIPKTTSDLTNNSGYITKTVDNLTNYYLKTETYTQDEINELIGNINKLDSKIVDVLPTESISTSTVYLIKVADTTNYTQHMYIDGSWAELGTTQIDLTDYYNKTQADSKFATIETVETHTSDTDIHVNSSEKSLISKIPSNGKLCATSVEDVSLTSITCTVPEEITIPDGYALTEYIVKNGIASIHFTWYITSATKVTTWTEVATNLPIPAIEQRTFIFPETNITNGNVGININTAGKLKILLPSDITVGDWWKGTITYPVA